MAIQDTLPKSDLISEIKDKETQLYELEKKLAQTKFELQELKRINAQNVIIPWRESIKWCLTVDETSPFYFIKTPAFVAKCIASKHGVEITRDIKNKISTTLSIMYNQGLVGRFQHNGKSFYGQMKFFKKDKINLKTEYFNYINDLNRYQ